MTNSSNQNAQEPTLDALEEGGARRRRLIRAGLSAAPVMMAFKSQSVLAADICIKPSSFSSFAAATRTNARLSHAPNAGYACYSHGYWKNTEQHPHPWPYTTLAKSFFLGVPPGAPSGSVSAGFSRNPGTYSGKTLIQVLELPGNNDNVTALARHVVATFLTAVSQQNDPTKIILTIEQCKSIWEGQGIWSPATGVNWQLNDTMDYFNYVYGGTLPV